MERIRPTALAIIRRGDEILVCEGYDRVKEQRFLRPPGGGIEFGEYAHEAVRREIREELGAELNDVRLLATVENIFSESGRPGHEIVMLFEATLADRSLYERESLDANEAWSSFKAIWVPLHDLGGRPLYPDGLLELLR